jgi:hypothetical protein
MKFVCKLCYKNINVLKALFFLFRSKFLTRRNSMEVGCQKKPVVPKHAVQIKLSVEFQSECISSRCGEGHKCIRNQGGDT